MRKILRHVYLIKIFLYPKVLMRKFHSSLFTTKWPMIITMILQQNSKVFFKDFWYKNKSESKYVVVVVAERSLKVIKCHFYVYFFNLNLRSYDQVFVLVFRYSSLYWINRLFLILLCYSGKRGMVLGDKKKRYKLLAPTQYCYLPGFYR